MAITRSTTRIAPGQTIDVSIRGAISAFTTAANFREALINQLTMRGLRVHRLAVDTGYGLASKDYTADGVISSLSVSTVAHMVGEVMSAAEGAGSYTPTVSVPTIGEAPQERIPEGAVDEALAALAKVPQTVTDLPGDLLGSVNLIVVGIVVLVGFLVFSEGGRTAIRAGASRL